MYQDNTTNNLTPAKGLPYENNNQCPYIDYICENMVKSSFTFFLYNYLQSALLVLVVILSSKRLLYQIKLLSISCTYTKYAYDIRLSFDPCGI